MSDTPSIDIGAAIDGADLYNAIRDADHLLDERGYSRTNENIKYGDGDVEFDVDDDVTGESNATVYHTQFKNLDEGNWVHVDVPAEETDEIQYRVTMGDPETIVDDLETALADIVDRYG